MTTYQVRKVFTDPDSNIYVWDINKILYLYENDQLYPFPKVFSDVTTCFMFNGLFIVHSEQRLFAFNDNLDRVHWFRTLFTDKVEYIAFHPKQQFLVVQFPNEVCAYVSVDEETYERVSLTRKVFSAGGSVVIMDDNIKYKSIKLIGDYLFLFGGEHMDLIDTTDYVFTKIMSRYIDNKTFQKIDKYDQVNNIIGLNDGNLIYLRNNYTSKPKLECKLHLFFNKENSTLIIYHTIKHTSLIAEIINLLPVEKTDIALSGEFVCTTEISLKENHEIQLLINDFSQTLLINKKIYTIINDHIREIRFDIKKINYELFTGFAPIKDDSRLVIDIDMGSPLFPQMANIIPRIYRLNSETNFAFEYISNKGEVISYGDGVTRTVLNALQKEIDQYLEKNLEGLSGNEILLLGKLIYFCNIESQQKFKNLHPYFFFILANNKDSLLLLEKFKPNEIYHKQYLEYSEHPEKLSDLDMGLETCRDYVGYLLGSNLDEEQTKNYQLLVDGYWSYLERNDQSKIIRKLPITLLIDQLAIDKGQIFIFEFKLPIGISMEQGDEYTQNFKKLFEEFDMEKKRAIVQNITGSKYYADKITIYFNYNPILVGIHRNYDPKTIYQIMTCSSELMVNVEPTKENLKKIMEILVIEDHNIKN